MFACAILKKKKKCKCYKYLLRKMSLSNNVASTTASSSASSSTGTNSKSEIFFNMVHERNIGSVRKLLDVSLPVSYGNDWYNDVLKTPQEFTKMGKLE